MARLLVVFYVACFFASVMCKPFTSEGNDVDQPTKPQPSVKPRLWKRFVNPSYSGGRIADIVPESKMRMKRSENECEKLQLCKLHARSGHSFLASFQLYFVNKENAKLWDHQAHSAADCARRFSGCYDDERPAAAAAVDNGPRQKQYQFIDYDYS